MKRRLAGGAFLALAACATASAPSAVTALSELKPAGQVTAETLLALNAMCRAEGSTPAASVVTKINPGVGTGGFKADTTNAEAQAWFDYGLSLSHAFYHEDAKRALIKAAELDPTCSICAWGEAWGRGPTLNYAINETQRVEALAAAERALKLAKPGDERARKLAEAAVARHQKGAKEQDYGRMLQAIADAEPDQLELAVLAAHSLMIPVRGGDESGLKPSLALLERVLKARPDDTGAIHYYIHGTEFDGRAEDAIPYAEQLGRLAPKASHLVHMPAHTFFRAGRYQEAAVVNAQAISADGDWMADGGEKGGFVPMYYSHNLAFGLGGALMSGDEQLAMKYVTHAVKVYAGKPEAARRYPVPRTWVALARYAPDQALAVTETGEDPRFAVYRHYARGEALLLKGDVKGAKAEAVFLSKVAAKGKEQGKIARDVLKGRIAMAEGRHGEAARLFDKAAKLQEAELNDFMDPPEWWYPVRRSVAAAKLKAGDFAGAEADARTSLAAWKHDPLALWVLAQAEAGQGKAAEAAVTLEKARKGWRGDFGSITAEAI